MRPKREVLLIDTNEDRQGITRFVLTQHALEVISAATPDEALNIERADVVVAYWAIDCAALDKLGKRLDARTILVAPDLTVPPRGAFMDALLLGDECTAANLIDRIKIFASRKRGPKKGYKRKPVTNDNAVQPEQHTAAA
jgi:hypothetical protein